MGVHCVGVVCMGGQFLNFFNLLSLSFVIPVNIRPILNADIFS